MPTYPATCLRCGGKNAVACLHCKGSGCARHEAVRADFEMTKPARLITGTTIVGEIEIT